MTTNAIQEGDIFRWRYKNPPEFRPYHCKSCICIAKNGRLVDTYWSCSGDSTAFAFDDERIVLEFVANQSDLIPVPPYQADYYDDEFIVDLRHANTWRDGDFYLRKTRVKSKQKMLNTANRRIDEAVSEIRFQEQKIERIREMKVKINDGKLDEVYL